MVGVFMTRLLSAHTSGSANIDRERQIADMTTSHATAGTTTQPVALVTGVSSGIGAATATHLHGRGYRVFGTIRSLQSAAPPGVEAILMDVRDERSVTDGVATVLETAGRIDALINNAGIALVSAVQETDLDRAREVFDVNFFGAVRVTRAVLPAMRRQGRGRLVFLSSVLGFLPGPYMAFYTASKHSLEGFSESLDHEVRGFGIRASLVEPGFVSTRGAANAEKLESSDAGYARAVRRASTTFESGVGAGADPAIVARVIEAAISAKRPRLRYTAGQGAVGLRLFRTLTPAAIFDRALRRTLNLTG
jgi:NAD(P)-dependent dehydrogenase (short-subunit alcohol dehydrogenase family)